MLVPLNTRHWPAPSGELLESLTAIPGVRLRGRLLLATADVAEQVARTLGSPGVSLANRHFSTIDPQAVEYPSKAFPWQRDGAMALARGDKLGLMWGCGVGKSGTLVMAAALRRASSVLVLTRAIGRHVYARDSVWAAPGKRIGIIVGTGKRSAATDYIRRRVDAGLESFRKQGADCGVYATVPEARRECWMVVVGWEILAAHLDGVLTEPWDIAIADESHMIKTRAIKAERADGSLHRNRTAAAHAIVPVAPVRWLATATPVRNRLDDLWGQWRFVEAGLGGSWGFVHRYSDAKPRRYGGLDTSGRSNTDELRARLAFNFDFRTRRTIAHLLPPKQRNIIRVPNDAREFVRHRAIEDAIAWAAEVKSKDVVDHVVEALYGHEKIVLVGIRKVWVQQMANAIERELRRSPNLRQSLWIRTMTGVGTSGGTTAEGRRQLAAEFVAARPPALAIATLPAISESIDMQDADRMILAALPVTPGELIQVEGRVSRPGQQRPVTIDYMIAEGTVDEEIEDLLLSKLAAVESAGAHTEDSTLLMPTEPETAAALSDWLKRSWEQAEKGNAA